MRRAFLAFLAFLLATFAIQASAADTERMSIVTNGENVGSIVAVTERGRVVVDFRVDNNGRGPKHREEIAIGPDNVPVSWTIAGTSLMGGTVNESFRWANGRAQWSSQADHGSVEAKATPLYIVNDDSPWAAGIYTRAALAQPGAKLAVLPGGTVSVTKARDLTIGSGSKAVAVTVYRLTGVQLNPGYVMLDRQRHLFATFGIGEGEVAIRVGYETAVPTINRLFTEIEAERVRDFQRRLAHRFDTPVRIANVRIFDPASGKRSPLATVVVMRDTITRVIVGDDEPQPSDETVIDGEGGTLYPGLHDMHSHATWSSGLLYLAAGVTATRDMGNHNHLMLDLLPRIVSGEVAWPRIVPNGFLEGRSPYSARFGMIPATLDEALADVRWYADRGYFEIKLYNSMNPDWVKPIAAEAHRLGLGVTGHVPAFDSPDRVIADGYDTIAHINQLMLGWILDPKEDTRTPLRLTGMARAGALDLGSEKVQRTVRAMREKGIALDTTASIIEQLMLSRAGQVPPGQDYFLPHMPIGFQRYRKRSFVTLKDESEDHAYQSGFAKVLEVVGMLHRDGIKLLPGTDDATGFSVHREIELYVKAGLTPAEALRAATLGCEEYFKRSDRLGTIERGKLADMVLVAGDPTQDITAIRTPRMVMRDGTVYFPSEIYSALEIAPFAKPPIVRTAKVTAAEDGAGGTVGFGYGNDLHDH